MREVLRRWRWEVILVAILAAVLVVNVSLSPFYLSVQNFINVFQLSIEKVIVAVIMTFIIVNGEIDLSVAAVMALSASVLGVLHVGGNVPFELAIVIALLAAVAAGLIQGLFVAKLGLPSLVVTLAGLIGLRGIARILLEDTSAGDFPEWFDRLGQDPLVDRFSFALILFFIGIAVAGVVLHRTTVGRAIYTIGNNPDVGRYSGLNVARTKLLLLTSSAFVSGVAGILYAARLGSVRANLAEGFELDIITMVLLGGVSIFGGTGSMPGVALSIFIILNIRNGLGLARIAVSTQTGVIGALLIMSVVVPNLVDRFARRRPKKADDSRSPPDPAAGDSKGGGGPSVDGPKVSQVATTEGGTG